MDSKSMASYNEDEQGEGMLPYRDKSENTELLVLIERIEDYSCCMSCYGTLDELRGAQQMREVILRILKGE